MLAALEADGCWPMLDAVLTGYFAAPGAVAAAAEAIGRIKAANPRAGRAGRPGARRRRPALRGAGDGRGDPRPAHPPRQPSPRPTCSSSAGSPARPCGDRDAATAAARKLGPPRVVVTSAAETASDVATLLVTRDRCIEHSAAEADRHPERRRRSAGRTAARPPAQRAVAGGGPRRQPRRSRPRAGRQRRPRRAAAFRPSSVRLEAS